MVRAAWDHDLVRDRITQRRRPAQLASRVSVLSTFLRRLGGSFLSRLNGGAPSGVLFARFDESRGLILALFRLGLCTGDALWTLQPYLMASRFLGADLGLALGAALSREPRLCMRLARWAVEPLFVGGSLSLLSLTSLGGDGVRVEERLALRANVADKFVILGYWHVGFLSVRARVLIQKSTG
jgi:hypothetical protein